MHFLIGAVCMLMSTVIIYHVLSREDKQPTPIAPAAD
jgi:RsiW-degrading membrane proteinase PrsW (M82 family)